VFEVNGYNNSQKAFEGRSNVNKDVPLSNGTYYYLIDRGTGSNKKDTGFFILNK